MKDKAPLALLEQTVMILVFAFAAALCLRVFVWSDIQSDLDAATDRSVIAVQSAAETLKHCNGDLKEASEIIGGTVTENRWSVSYDENWQVIPENGKYIVTVRPFDSGVALLGEAEISAQTATGEALYSLTVGWQEVQR